MIFLNPIFYLLFIMAIGYYTITNLQWNNYMLSRVIFHHTKPWWHVVYFLIPFALYEYIASVSDFAFVVAIGYIVAIYMWYRSLDKPLVFTGRVKRFMVVLLFASLFIAIVFGKFMVIVPILIAYLISILVEKILFDGFKKKAEKKIRSMDRLTVIGITASYGKTSIKNYIEHLLRSRYKTYATPRSVNTLGGIIRDINEQLPADTEVYVVEMGARGEGDISEITTFVNPQLVVVGKIGPAHIEYFKTMENIRNTKMEIMQSDRVRQAWIHDSANVKAENNIHIYGADIEQISATLESTSFTLDETRYSAKILGAFNAMNLAVAVKVAIEMGLNDEQIQNGLSTLKPVDHRLQRIDAGGKIILDDSFNGNIDGMMASFELASTHTGRKVITTPGLVEVDDDLNIQVAQRANEVFDLVIVSGELNYSIFKEYIDNEKLLKLASKSEMESMLIKHTKAGDLILFANDAPNFV